MGNDFNLKIILLEAGFKSQDDFARTIGKSNQTVSKWFINNSVNATSIDDLVLLLNKANKNTNGKYQDIIDTFIVVGWIKKEKMS